MYVVLLGDVFLVTSGVSWLSCWQNCSVSIFRLRGPILVSVLSVFVLLLGVTPAHAASLGKLKVSIVAPKGVAVSVAMIKSSKRVVYTKPGSLSSATVTKKVPAGTWKPGLSPVKLGNDFYVPTANKSAVKVKKGKTASVKVTYTKAPVVDKARVWWTENTSATIVFEKPTAETNVRVRVLPGATAPSSVTAGVQASVVGSRATATGLKANQEHTFAVFTKAGARWYRTAVIKASTTNLTESQSRERKALLAFITQDESDMDESSLYHGDSFYRWGIGDQCDWYFITCGESGKVEELEIPFYGNFGAVPAEIGELTNLTKLEMYGAGVTSLPPEIGKLNNLKELNLSENSFLRTLPPEIGKLNKLERLKAENALSGALPVEFGNLKNLRYLDVSYSGFGNFPNAILELESLEVLYMRHSISGPIPEDIDRLTKLKFLDVEKNGLTVLPDQIGNLAALEGLYIAENELEALPGSIRNLTSLRLLGARSNNLHGDISSWVRAFKENGVMSSLVLRGNGCMNVGGDTDLEQWLDGHDPDWRNGCKDM